MYPYDVMGEPMSNDVEELQKSLDKARQYYAGLKNNSQVLGARDPILSDSLLHWIERLERKIEQAQQREALEQSKISTKESLNETRSSNRIAMIVAFANIAGVIVAAIVGCSTVARISSQVDLQRADLRPYLAPEEASFPNGQPRPILTEEVHQGTNRADLFLDFYLSNLGKTPASYSVGPSLSIGAYVLTSSTINWTGVSKGIIMPGQKVLVGIQILNAEWPGNVPFNNEKFSIPIEYYKVGEENEKFNLTLVSQDLVMEGTTSTAQTSWLIDSAN